MKTFYYSFWLFYLKKIPYLLRYLKKRLDLIPMIYTIHLSGNVVVKISSQEENHLPPSWNFFVGDVGISLMVTGAMVVTHSPSASEVSG